MISFKMTCIYSIKGISLMLKSILFTLLKLASNNKIALSLVTLTIPGFFSNITDIPFVQQCSGDPFLMAKLTSLHFIFDSK